MPENSKHDIFGADGMSVAGAISVEWLGHSNLFAFGDGSTPDFMALTEPAVGTDLALELSKSSQIAIAIDAPIAFPIQFQKLLNGVSVNVG